MFELAKTLPETGTGSVETVENLRRLKRRVGKGSAITYVVQIFNEPHQIVALEVRHALPILLPIKHIGKLIVKLG